MEPNKLIVARQLVSGALSALSGLMGAPPTTPAIRALYDVADGLRQVALNLEQQTRNTRPSGLEVRAVMLRLVDQVRGAALLVQGPEGEKLEGIASKLKEEGGYDSR